MKDDAATTPPEDESDDDAARPNGQKLNPEAVAGARIVGFEPATEIPAENGDGSADHSDPDDLTAAELRETIALGKQLSESIFDASGAKLLSEALKKNFEATGLDKLARDTAQAALAPAKFADLVATPATRTLLDALSQAARLDVSGPLWADALSTLNENEKRNRAAHTRLADRGEAGGADDRGEDEDDFEAKTIAHAESMVNHLEFIGGVLAASQELAEKSAEANNRIAAASEENAELARNNADFAKKTFGAAIAIASLTFLATIAQLVITIVR